MREYPGRLHHQTPGWVPGGAAFHVRIRASSEMHPLTQPNTAGELLASARRYHDLAHWWCTLFLLMPDHVHAIVSVPRTSTMSTTVMNFKRATTRFQSVRWQSGYFDHRLRSPDDARETWDYIRLNPVVKGLCTTGDEWPWWWSAFSSDVRK
jgi:REP element-mobilizing transposase RayT